MIDSFADIMQQAGTLGLFDIDPQFGRHDAAEECDLQGVLQHVLAVGSTILETADQLDDLRVNAVHTDIKGRLLTGFADGVVHLLGGLADHLLDACRVNPAVSDELV